MTFEFLSNKYFIVVLLCVIFFSSVSSLIMLSVKKKDANDLDTISTMNLCNYVIMGIAFLLGLLMIYLQLNNIIAYDSLEVPIFICIVGVCITIASSIQLGYASQLSMDVSSVTTAYIVNLVSGIILIAYAVVLYKKAPAAPEKKPEEKKSGSYLADLQVQADKAEKIAEENLTKFGSDSSEYIKANKEANDLNDKLREFEDNLKLIQKRRDQNKKVKEMAAGKGIAPPVPAAFNYVPLKAKDG